MADGDPPALSSRPRVWRTGLTPGSAAVLVGAVVAAFVLRDVFVAAHRTVGWVVACGIVALLIDPLVALVDRLLPRVLAVIVVLLALMAVIGTVVAGVAGDVVDSLDDLKASAPEAAQELEQRYDWLAEVHVGERVEDFVGELDRRVRKDAVSHVAETVPTYVVTGILMLFLLAYGRRYFNGFVDQFAEERRPPLRAAAHETAVRGRTYLLVALGMAIVYGVAVGLLCWSLDLPAAVSLGFVAGALTPIPLFGVVLGGIPALLLASGLEGWRTGAVVLAALLVLQTIEALAVRPYVDARTVRVGPTLPIVVAVLGFELYGAGGAVYGFALIVLALAALDAAGRARGTIPAEPAAHPPPAGTDPRSVPDVAPKPRENEVAAAS